MSVARGLVRTSGAREVPACTRCSSILRTIKRRSRPRLIGSSPRWNANERSSWRYWQFTGCQGLAEPDCERGSRPLMRSLASCGGPFTERLSCGALLAIFRTPEALPGRVDGECSPAGPPPLHQSGGGHDGAAAKSSSSRKTLTMLMLAAKAETECDLHRRQGLQAYLRGSRRVARLA